MTVEVLPNQNWAAEGWARALVLPVTSRVILAQMPHLSKAFSFPRNEEKKIRLIEF